MDAWAASQLEIQKAIDGGAGVVTSDMPQAVAPVAIALDPAASADGSLLEAVDAAITDMRADGRLATMSADELGMDLSGPPANLVPQATRRTGDPLSTGDADLAARVPASIAGSPVSTVGVTAQDLVSLLSPMAPARSPSVAAFTQSVQERGASLADLAMVFGVIVDGQGRPGRLTLAKLPGAAPTDLVDAVADLLVGPDVTPESVTVSGVVMDRYRDEVPTADGAATHLATSDDAVVAITARPPLLGRLVRALLR